MLPPVFQLLKASTAVKAIVGSNPPRIYRHGSAPSRPDNLPMDQPYITWQLIAGTPLNNLSDTPPRDEMAVQVDAWHQTDSGVEALAVAIRDAIEARTHMTSILLDLREAETKLFRISLQFDFWQSRG